MDIQQVARKGEGYKEMVCLRFTLHNIHIKVRHLGRKRGRDACDR